MPVIAQRPDTIDAKIYNLWRRTRLITNKPVYLKLSGLKTMRFILADEHWVVADSANYYAPIIAWTRFKTLRRENLHQPIKCTTNYYHFAASAVRAKSLMLMTEMLEARLGPTNGEDDTYHRRGKNVHYLLR